MNTRGPLFQVSCVEIVCESSSYKLQCIFHLVWSQLCILKELLPVLVIPARHNIVQ